MKFTSLGKVTPILGCISPPKNTWTYSGRGPCFLCDDPMTLAEILEGITWEESPSYEANWCWWDEDDVARIAHRRCWKRISENRRELIRKFAQEPPRSFGSFM